MKEYVFQGFAETKSTPACIPEEFFREVLPRLRDMAEVKTVLHFFWLTTRPERARRKYRYVTLAELADDKPFLAGLGRSSREGTRLLPQALEKAVSHAIILSTDVELDGRRETWYFLNDSDGREAIGRIEEEGPEVILSGKSDESAAPNIFTLYEENIGMIQPLLAEELKDAVREYPAEWIEEAFRIAAENNARRWSYVRAVLERWRTEGKEERKADTDSLSFRMRYAKQG